MPATVRLGTCSWADEGLLKAWYPCGVSRAAGPPAVLRRALRRGRGRLALLRVPRSRRDPPLGRADARRVHLPRQGGRGDDLPRGRTERRAHSRPSARSVEPLELSGKLRGLLLEYHPRFVKSAEAKADLALARDRLDPLVPLIEFRHRSWMEFRRALGHARLSRGARALVRLGRCAARLRATNVAPRVAAATHPVSRDPLPRPQLPDLEHPRRQRRRPLRLALLRRGVGRMDRPDPTPRRAGRRGLRALRTTIETTSRRGVR